MNISTFSYIYLLDNLLVSSTALKTKPARMNKLCVCLQGAHNPVWKTSMQRKKLQFKILYKGCNRFMYQIEKEVIMETLFKGETL